MALRMRHILILLLWHQLLLSKAAAQNDFFTSTSHIAQLPTMKHRLADALLGYADNETARLDKLREFARDLQRPPTQEAAVGLPSADGEGSSHPVEAFLTIRRMGHDWRRLMGSCGNAPDSMLNASGLELPTSVDYDGAIDALLRLQDVYGISAESMARGQLTVGSQGKAANRSAPVLLSAEDCLSMVRRALNRSQGEIGMEWIRMLLTTDAFQPSERAMLLPSVLELLQHWFETETRQHDKVGPFLASVWRYSNRNVTVLAQSTNAILPMEQSDEDLKNYKRLCKDGSYINPNKSTSGLVCRNAIPHPFFTLAPVKEELLNEDPRVVFLYDVLTDAESNRLMEVADPLLKRARIISGKTVDIRISKSAFMADDDDWSVGSVSRKLAAITGLNMTISDNLQMGNYGIGGQYEPHMDSFGTGVSRGNNRVATVLLYLNNVTQGGGTVFPRLGLRVLPVKNGALFWYNMRRNSSDITDTTHAACPVLEGSKWVANKWIYYLGQMHSRPCSLNQFE